MRREQTVLFAKWFDKLCATVLLLLCGGHKGTQKADIKQAHAIKEYLEGKYEK